MALNNCTINSSSVEVTPSQVLGSGVANQVLTITPHTGYVVAAADFTNNSGTLTGITSIALANSGVAYADNNTVTVTVDLDNSFNPGTNNHTITIDIDGDAVLEKDKPTTLAGTYTVDGTNITQSDETNVAYSVTGTQGSTQDIISKTVTASTGKYFETEPTIVITGDLNDYEVTTTNSNDGSGNLTSKVFDIDAVMPLEDVSGDTIVITASAVTIPEDLNRINAYSFDTSDMAKTLIKRPFKAYGDIGAKFKLKITRPDNYTFNFDDNDFTNLITDSGELTIGSDGSYSTLLTFPVVTDDVVYTFEIVEVSPTTLNIVQDNPFTVSRIGFKSVTVNASSTSRGTLTSKVISYTNYAGTTLTQSGSKNPTWGQAGQENDLDNDAEFNFNIVIQDDEAFQFSPPNAAQNSITLDSSSYSSVGNADIIEGTITATRAANDSNVANKKLTIAGVDWFNFQYSQLIDHVVTFNIDNFCDNSPGGGGGSDTLELGTTRWYRNSSVGVGAGIMVPDSYSQTVTGRQTGSTTIVYEVRNLILTYPEVPSFVDYPGDISAITASSISPSNTKFSPSSLSPPISSYPISNISHTITNGGTTNVSVSSNFDITITNFSPAVAADDEIRLQVNFTYTGYNQ